MTKDKKMPPPEPMPLDPAKVQAAYKALCALNANEAQTLRTGILHTHHEHTRHPAFVVCYGLTRSRVSAKRQALHLIEGREST